MHSVTIYTCWQDLWEDEGCNKGYSFADGNVCCIYVFVSEHIGVSQLEIVKEVAAKNVFI